MNQRRSGVRGEVVNSHKCTIDFSTWDAIIIEKKAHLNNSWGIWEHLGGQFLHGHAEWIETRDLILGSNLRIKDMAL